MNDLENYRKPFTIALRLLLMRWKLWIGKDEIRALDISFDCFNTEICISLLTDNEPTLELEGLNAMQEPWPVASWRLTGIGNTGKHCFPDAADLVEWMKIQSRKPISDDQNQLNESQHLNESLKKFFFEIATSDTILKELSRFSRVSKPFHIRVHWFSEQLPSLRYIVN